MNLNNTISGLETKLPEYSIRLWLNAKNRIYFSFIPLILMMAIIFDSKQAFLILFFILNTLYFIAQVFKLILVVIGAKFQIKQEDNYVIPESLPIYTILLPIYKENKILNGLISSMKAIDYPSHLLDIKLLVEEDDFQILAVLDKMILPEFFDVIKVPVSYPRTKPKACNYGLQFAKGKYITIYDAEDRPAMDQLKLVVAKFAISDSNVACIQAKLNYYNREENYLTKLFAIEFSLLFEYVMLGLKKLDMPIPLGGSSNHFIREKFEELGGWDAFNVTEDADLGIRLHHRGYQTELIDSITLEESPISMHAWLVQRARWIKGHVLTSLLHLRQSNKLKRIDIIGIALSLYLPNLIYILLPIYLTLSCFIIDTKEVDIIWQINVLLGIILPVIFSIFILIRKKWRNMLSAILLSVFYYLLFPIAGIRACFQIFTDPFVWDKTEHGISIYTIKDEKI